MIKSASKDGMPVPPSQDTPNNAESFLKAIESKDAEAMLSHLKNIITEITLKKE